MTSEEKFHAAVNVIRSLPKNGSYQPSNELMLRFYAYFKQATLGPCKGARPAFWDVVGRAKHSAWARLGDMSRQAAMDAYVAELHRIVETMSYNDNVANFLEAQHELDSVNMGDLELVAGDVIERVRSQPNSPFASREASPTRLSPAVTPPLQTQNYSAQESDHSDHSDDEYIDTMDSEPETKLMNGHVEPVSNGHVARSHIRTTKTKVDVSAEVQRTMQSLQADLDRLNNRVTNLEKVRKSHASKGLCGGPDAPGVHGGPPPAAADAKRLTFKTRGAGGAGGGSWDTLLIGRVLYVALPPHILPEGSRDAFVALLEAAEERLGCQHVVVVFGADRPDRAVLVRTFMFLGFAVLAPSSPLVPPGLAANANLCMLYNIE